MLERDTDIKYSQLVETDINKRWEEGIPHHPKSIEAIEAISDIDFRYADLVLDIRTGGDGDIEETMMYLLDIYFEYQDKKKEVNRCEVI